MKFGSEKRWCRVRPPSVCQKSLHDADATRKKQYESEFGAIESAKALISNRCLDSMLQILASKAHW